MILLILLGLVGIVMLIAVGKKAFKKNGMLKTVFLILGIVVVAYSAVGIGGQLGWYELPDSVSSFFLTAGISAGGSGGSGEIQCPSGTVLQNGVCVAQAGGGANYQPTGDYSAKDKYSTTSISGTSYYKRGTNSATTTQATNLNIGEVVTYWVDNSTYWVGPVTKTAGQGVTPFEALGWSNSSATITLYDSVGRATVTNGASNVSMGANAQASIEITYDGTAKGSAGPFGGIMVVEYNNTMSSVICTGDQIMDSNPFHLTYPATATTHVHKMFPYSSEMDNGDGKPRRIDCEFLNGASAVGAGSAYYVKFYPANWYVTQAGDIVLDTEKFADGDTTKTGSTINLPSATAYWGA